MGWTLHDNGVGRKWVTHTGEFADSADVDSMLSWFEQRGMKLVMCTNNHPQGMFLIEIGGDQISIMMAGSTMKSVLIDAIRAIVA
jgi:hypothetical protein